MIETRCSSGKRIFENESIALDALIQHHIMNDYHAGQGPKNIYQCEECGLWHFTSKGVEHHVLKEEDTIEKIRKERIAFQWERKLR